MGSPIFIVGAVRSGTTLMRLILDSHDNIAIPHETGFMRAAQAHQFIPFWKFGKEWYQHLGLTGEDLDRQLGSFYGSIFGNFARAQGKGRWGEKTPWHLWHIPGILRMWPRAVFVGMVRHPVGNVGSLMSRWHFELEQSIRIWTRDNTELLYRAVTLADRFALCRYEDLLQHPEQTLRELLAWLGEPWSPQVLRHHEVQRSRGGPSVVEGKTRADEPLDRSRATRWGTLLSGDDQQMLELEAKKLADLFGYSFKDMGTLRPIVPEDAGRTRILLGSDLPRLHADPDLLDGSARTPAPAKEQPYDPKKLGVHMRKR